MERLTIEEAINREKMMAKRKRWNGKFTKVSQKNEEINKRFKADCIKDAEEHEQLAEWLEELKSYKEAEEQGLLVRVSRVKRRLEQFQKDLTSQTIYKEGLPGSALDIVNILIADLAADEREEEG